MKYGIGIDIGGTNIRMGLVSADGKIFFRKKMPTGPKRGPNEIIVRLAKAIQSLKSKFPQARFQIGMGVPGIVSAQRGIVYSSPHFPPWKDFPIAHQLSQLLGDPVMIDNDAHMISRGEAWKGAGMGWEHFLMITLGTGLGGALVINGDAFLGTQGFAGESGHMVIEAEGPPCACGSHGCLETFVSATALTRMIREELKKKVLPDIDPLKALINGNGAHVASGLSLLAARGNRAALWIYERMGYYLGVGLASMINVTGIQKIVIGGGLKKAHPYYLPAAKAELVNRTYAKTAEDVEIRLAKLNDDAGILGAAMRAIKGIPPLGS